MARRVFSSWFKIPNLAARVTAVDKLIGCGVCPYYQSCCVAPARRRALCTGFMASTSGRKLNIVVEGCCHGELPKIYASVHKMEQVRLMLSSTVVPEQTGVLLPLWCVDRTCRYGACTVVMRNTSSPCRGLGWCSVYIPSEVGISASFCYFPPRYDMTCRYCTTCIPTPNTAVALKLPLDLLL